MSNRTYRVTEIVGTSPDGIDQAIRNGIERALGSAAVAGRDRDLVTLGDECLGDRAADAAVAAGHQDRAGLGRGGAGSGNLAHAPRR